MQWTLEERGFLPVHDPVSRLTDVVFQEVERLGEDLPRLTHAQTFRAESRAYLKGAGDWQDKVHALPDAEVERLFMLFSYFASAYVHAPGLPAVQRLPAYLAVPLVRLAGLVDRPPILSYASYCLHNWRRLDPAGPVALGNIALLQNFSLPDDGKTDEDWFILVHVDIEARAGAALRAVSALPPDAAPEQVADILARAGQGLAAMNATMARMPEGCSPDVYFRKVRPYIFGFNDIIYEGCFDERPQTFRGETGAQSSIVPTMLAALGIHHKDSLLTQHLGDMRTYMPRPHRQFIERQPSIRPQVLSAVSTPQGAQIRALYNECVSQLLAFRSRHFEYAVNYIERKVANPIATGGTPYIPWLHQLIEETKGYFIGQESGLD